MLSSHPAAPRIAAPIESRLFAQAHREFDVLVTPHVASLRRACFVLADSREASEDLLQNVLVQAYLYRHTFRGPGSALGWLRGIARNEWMETVRTTARRRGLVQHAVARAELPESDWLTARFAVDPETCAVVDQDLSWMRATLRGLPEEFRAVLVLCDIEEMSHDEAAEALHIPIGTVKSRQARARARMRRARDTMH